MVKNLSSKTKECNVCRRTLPVNQFGVRKDNTIFNGRAYKTCNGCRQGYQEKKELAKSSAPVLRSGPVAFVKGRKIEGEDKKLDILLQLQTEKGSGWTYEQAHYLMEGLLEFANTTGIVNYNQLFRKYGSGKNAASCNTMLKEVKQAAAKNMTLKRYWEAGRPFKHNPAGKVLVPGKKKGA